MSYSIEFVLNGLPHMANPSGKSTHWRGIHAEAQKWKWAVCQITMGKRPKKPLERYKLTLVRFSSKEPDFDGLVRGFKSVVDGLRAADVISDDKLKNSGVWHCQWMKCGKSKGRISVRVDEVAIASESDDVSICRTKSPETREASPELVDALLHNRSVIKS